MNADTLVEYPITCQKPVGAYYRPLRGNNKDVYYTSVGCLEEVTLTSAYVFENDSGQFKTWNCRIHYEIQEFHVYPSESVVTSIHVNLSHTYDVIIHFTHSEKSFKHVQGMCWLHV